MITIQLGLFNYIAYSLLGLSSKIRWLFDFQPQTRPDQGDVMSDNDDITKYQESFKKKMIVGLIVITIALFALYVLIRIYK
jgi:hypothetical protein